MSTTSTPFMVAAECPSPLPVNDNFQLDPTTAQQQRDLLEEYRAAAEMHNADETQVQLLRFPMDLWEWVTCFLTYHDVVALASTSRALWRCIIRRNSIWEQQLRFFHDDMLELRGGTLLLTDFAIPRSDHLAAYERLKRERRLYVADGHREWHFKDLSTLEDVETGIFTTPLHLGYELTSSDAAAPLSRPAPPSPRRTLSSGNPSSPVMASHADYPGATAQAEAPSATSIPVARMQAVGAAAVGVEGTLPIRIWKPLRECPLASTTGESEWHSGDVPRTADEEEVDFLYALALSEAEANGLPPPLPPLLSHTRATRQEAFSLLHTSPFASFPEASSPTQSSSRYHRPPSPPSPQYLTTGEIMTIVDLLQLRSTYQSRVPVQDVTAEEDPAFLLALRETLKGAQRRRLYLGNHHRAILNNGQTTRHRRGGGRPTFSQAQQTGREPSLGAALSPPSPPPPPPINRMLRHFTGELLEIELVEARQLCDMVLSKAAHQLDDFVHFHSRGARRAVQRGGTSSPLLPPSVGPSSRAGSTPASPPGASEQYPPTRFFIATELCRNGRIGLIVVDVVRVLVIVDDERTAVDDEHWEIDESAGRRLHGQGLNAQYYDPSRHM